MYKLKKYIYIQKGMKAKEKPPRNVTVLEGENMGMGGWGKWGFI